MLTLILKTSSIESAELREGKVRFSGDNRTGRDRSEIEGSEVDGGEVKDDKVEKKFQKMSKSKNLFKSKKTVGFLDLLTLGAKLAFSKLKQGFFKALILHHLDQECHIQIETDVSNYAIGGVFSLPTSNNLGQ